MTEILTALDYDDYTTGLCERAQLALLRCAGGTLQKRIFLAGGLVPRYLIQALPPGVEPHVGTTDVDFVVGVALLGDDDPEPYHTLAKNMRDMLFEPCRDDEGRTQSFRWQLMIDGKRVVVEFMTEKSGVPGGMLVRPGQAIGSAIGAFTAKGASLVAEDFVVREIRGRLPSGDESFASMQVANLAPFVTLKALALHERHKPKDSYDLVFAIGNWPGGPSAAAAAFMASPVYGRETVDEALTLMNGHFESAEMDGPGFYSSFMYDPGLDDEDEKVRLRLESLGVIHEFLGALGHG